MAQNANITVKRAALIKSMYARISDMKTKVQQKKAQIVSLTQAVKNALNIGNRHEAHINLALKKQVIAHIIQLESYIRLSTEQLKQLDKINRAITAKAKRGGKGKLYTAKRR
jgi:hypothetical protein